MSHFPYFKPQPGTTLTATRDAVTLALASGKIYRFPGSRDPQAFEHQEPLHVPRPSWVVMHSFGALDSFHAAITSVSNNSKLSAEGRRDVLAHTGRDPAITTLVAVHEDLQKFNADTLNREIQHYLVPELAANDVLGFLREQEVRNHIRSLGDRATAEMIRPLMEAKDPAIALAILHSALPLPSLQEPAAKSWRAYRDRQAPEVAAKVAMDKDAGEWAGAIVKVAADSIRRELTSPRNPSAILATDPQVLANAIPPGAHELFGLKAA